MILSVAVVGLSAHAQTNPTPNTFSTLAGSYGGGSYTVGAVCGGAGSGSKFTATDVAGDGCPLTQAILGPSLSGIGVDGAGNVFVNDYSNDSVRRIDARSGIVTKVVGAGNTLCSTTTSATGTKQDSIGSGCVTTSAIGPTSARGMNVDPWGNVILGGYNANQIDVVCLATSPLCPNTANRKQLGFLYRVAGCVATQGNSATANAGIVAYSSGDNSPASPFQNLSGDVTAWGLTGAAATAATVGATGNACTTTTGGVNSARNAQADKYGNVYIADTNGERYRVVLGPASYNGVTNPLFAIINMDPNYTANEGFIYTILGSFSAITSGGITYNVPTASGGACSSAGATPAATDNFGDGCLFFETGKPAGSTSPAGIGVDNDGNPIFSDNTDGLVRVLYVGGATMGQLISVNNGGVTPVVGTVYAIEGTGTASKNATPQLNVSTGSISSGNTKVAVDGLDNIYLSDGSGVNIIDSVTGYLRRPISTGGTACATGVNGNGDGCPPGQGTSWTSLSSVGTAIAVDNLGNLLLADSTGRVRKVLAGTLYPTAVGSTFTQNVVFHEPAGTTGITVALVNASPGVTIPSTAPSCTLFNAVGSDNTADCTVAVTFAPTVPGKVGATLSVTNVGASGATTLYPLIGTATGAALVTDVSNPTTTVVADFGANGLPTALAFDSGGNLYAVDNQTALVKAIASGGNTTVGTAPSNANQLAIDPSGNVYVTSIGSGSVTKYTLTGPGAYTSSTFTVPAVALPQGIAFDAQGNMYLSDATTKDVYEVPNNAGFANLQAPTILATGLANPTLLAIDGLGNVLIADTGIVYRVNASTGALTTVASASAGGVVLTGLAPVGLAADPGGNVYIQDGSTKIIFDVPYQTFTGGPITVLSGETSPAGIAIDGRGQIVAADQGSSPASIVSIQRASETYTFPTATSTFIGIFTNTGNANSTGYAETDTAEFPYDGSGTGGCGTISGTSPLLTGAACIFSVTPNLGSNGQLVTNTTTLLPATSIGFLALSAQEPLGVTYTTTTTVTGPATGVFLSSGAEITFTVAESSTNANSQNGENVNVTIDTGSPVAYVITDGSVSVPVSGLSAGPHTITAVYPGDGTYLTSTGSANFTITQASTTVAWTPSVTTQQFSAAIGAAVLDATATSSGLTAPGSFVYTATPASGPAVFIHSASYLPVGTYALGVTFIPTDSLDYAQSTATVATYTVTQATTTAALGASQFVVAADGTGNFSSVQAAVNSLPSGGSIYIKPGVYSGNIAVVQPNIALRGLGGDPTQVVLTHSGGAFNNGQVQNQFAGEFNQSQSNGSQLPAGSTVFTGDEASATLIVAKGINTAVSGSTLIPNNFYGENFSLINTYNTDTTTTTNVYTGGGATPCVVNSGAARTYSDLFNSGLECASQALAIWTTSDLAVMNNVYTASLQDTIYAASQGNSIPARQYWFRGKVTGTVDYIFGDAAAVFDNTSIYTAWHGNTATGTNTIHAQNKSAQTGSVGDYLSGYVMNNDVFTSQSTGMTNLYLGRPYGTYSTWIMLNSYIDQVNPAGYTTGLGPTLTPVTFSEYNDIPYTDPAPNAADLNGIPYVGSGGNAGAGVAGPREASSTNPGTPMATDNPPTAMTQAQAQAFFPGNFLSQPVAASSTLSWNPTAAIAANANAFVPTGTTATVAGGSSVTILMRPQTPGLGAISNGIYTLPTGTYTLTDTYNGGNPTILASGQLDASGEAYFTSSILADGTHNLSWSYSGDNNFAGSTTASPYVLTVTGPAASTTTTTLVVPQPTSVYYGSAAPVVVQVASSGGTPTGTATLTINGTQTLTATLSSGSATFSIPGLTAGTYSLSASYAGSPTFTPSSTASPSPLVVNPFPLTVTAACANRPFGQVNSCSATVTGGYQYSDSAATVFTAAPAATTIATRYSPANTYAVTPVYTVSAFGNTNYVVTPVNGSFTVTGNTNLAQTIIFAPLPNFASGGTYQLTARTTSGLPVSYTITGGNASISGSTLTVNGTTLVTVQATQTDPTGDYAPAAAVSRSFTPQ
ncbi:MAG TPA: pectinesterase family protein [Acidobacteriaceae bacterium]|nr:pectinesterase family protein [Acidobacteriaceae bacterium]